MNAPIADNDINNSPSSTTTTATETPLIPTCLRNTAESSVANSLTDRSEHEEDKEEDNKIIFAVGIF